MRALVIGASGGIGQAVTELLVERLGREQVHTASRSVDDLDITQESSVASLAARFTDTPLDLVFVATGALTVDGVGPERGFSRLDPNIMARSYAINAIGPAMLLKHLTPRLQPKGRSVFAVLSARIGSIEDNRLGGWMSYRASKAALNQTIRCASIEVARRRPEAVIAALHPGTIETPLSTPYARGRFTMTAPECAQRLLAVLDTLTPDDSGMQFAYDGTRIPG